MSLVSSQKRSAGELDDGDSDFSFNYEEASSDEETPQILNPKVLSHQEKSQVLGRTSSQNQERTIGALLFDNHLASLDALQEEPEQFDEADQSQPEKEAEIKSETSTQRKPAWTNDSEDKYKVPENTATLLVTKKGGKQKPKRIKYSEVVDAKFQEVYGPTPEWAKLDKKKSKEEQGDSEDEFYNPRIFGQKLASNQQQLDKDKIKCPSLGNIHSGAKDKITSIDFHPTVPMALIAGGHKKYQGLVAFYQVDGDKNSLIETKLIKSFPVTCGRLVQGGSKFLVGSDNQKYSILYDMQSGHETKVKFYDQDNDFTMKEFAVCPSGEFVLFYSHGGRMDLFQARHMSHITSMHVPATVSSACFTKDSAGMLCYGDNGVVYTYDMKNFQCSSRFSDDGCVHGTSLAVSPNDRYIACGSESGIVNIYDQMAMIDESRPKLIKSVGNLLTPISEVTFNSTSEILAMVSRTEKDSVKLVHLGSMGVCKKFPNPSKPMNRNWNTVSFSPGSGYMALGSFDGTARLFRMSHYTQY